MRSDAERSLASGPGEMDGLIGRGKAPNYLTAPQI